MTTIRKTTAVLKQAQTGIRRDLRQMTTDTARTCRALIVSSAGPDGTIPTRDSIALRRDVGDVVIRMFTGRDGRTVFDERGAALSPIGDAINRWVAWETLQMIRVTHNWMQNNVPSDVFDYLQSRHRPVSELTRTEQQRENARRLRIFEPNPLAQYDPLHSWVDPNGYVLSDRVWQSGQRTRTRVDALMGDGIAQGMSAVDLANRVERFIRPDRIAFRTQKPYGQDGSFDARRLARTEITAGAGRALMATAATNPWVSGIKWNLSPAHPKIDICDDYAGKVYPIGRVPRYPSHPHCLCYLTQEVAENSEVITAYLRLMMEDARMEARPYVNPADVEGFGRRLLGDFLYELALHMELTLAATVI